MAIGFISALLATYIHKRNVKKGKMDWQKYQRIRSNVIVVSVLGVISAPIFYYCLAKNVSVLELFLGEGVNFVSDLVVTGIIFFLCPVFLGIGLGFGLGSLIFPIKIPQQINKSHSGAS